MICFDEFLQTVRTYSFAALTTKWKSLDSGDVREDVYDVYVDCNSGDVDDGIDVDDVNLCRWWWSINGSIWLWQSDDDDSVWR